MLAHPADASPPTDRPVIGVLLHLLSTIGRPRRIRPRSGQPRIGLTHEASIRRHHPNIRKPVIFID